MNIFCLLNCSIEGKYEVTILGGLNEFAVKFYGPRGSKYCFYTSFIEHYVNITIKINLNFQLHMKEESGK